MAGLFTNHNVVSILGLTSVLFIGCDTFDKKEHRELFQRLETEQKNIEGAPENSPPSPMNQSLDAAVEKSNLVVSVVKRVMPAVVSIHSEKLVEVPYHQYFNPFEELFGGPRDKKTQKYKQQGLGSGVIVDKEGYIITNHHVAGEADDLMVTLSDTREFEAKIVGTDKLSDLAVIKIKKPPDDLPVATLGNSKTLEIGESVLAIGNPFGYSNTVTMGIISAKRRTVGINSYEDYLQTDASINPGNSGGALINLYGEVIGINTAIASRSGGSQGVGFAIPINMVRKIMQDLLEGGSVTRGYLGVYLQPLDKNIAEALNLKGTQGALVSKIIEDSPAEKAGLQEMDVIAKVDGKKVLNVNELRNAVALLKPGAVISFEIYRNGKSRKVSVKIGTREDETRPGKTPKKEKNDFGMSLSDIDYHSMKSLGLTSQEGVLVTDVEAGTLADESGLRRGDVIQEADRQRLANTNHFIDIIEKFDGDVLLMQILRDGSTMYLGLKLK